MNALMIIFNTVVCALTLWFALVGLNAATRQTPFWSRVGFALIACGAFAVLLHPPSPDIGGFGALAVVGGIAVGYLSGRKRCICLDCPVRTGQVVVMHDRRQVDRGPAVPT